MAKEKVISYPELGKKYLITNDGEVSNIKGYKLQKKLLCTGYYGVILKNCGFKKNYKIHRLVADHFVLNPLSKPHVHHRDHNKLNNHFSNLEWVTPQENSWAKCESYEIHPNSKKLYIQDTSTLKVQCFDSARSASIFLNIPNRTLTRLIDRKVKNNSAYAHLLVSREPFL